MNRREFLKTTGGLAAAGTFLAGSRFGYGAESKPRPPAAGPLRVHPDNPRYFTDGSGRAVYLTGSHTWPNLVDMGTSDPPPKFDFDKYLDFLTRHNHDFIRLWTWELVSWNTQANRENKQHMVFPHPYARTGPGTATDGKPKFDLTKYDPEYFRRLRTRVEAAGKRGIYVSVMLFEGWGLQRIPGSWKHHPYNPANNVNGIGGDVDGDTNGLEIYQLKSDTVRRTQEAYVRHAIDTVGDLDNVLYEISNENHPPSTPWQYHMIRFIKGYERDKARQHPVGMTFQFRGGSNRTLFESPADWISPNPEGGYRDNPPAADGSKVILTDTDHLWGIGGDEPWVWKSFLRGLNPLFMDPYDGAVLGRGDEPRWKAIRRSMGQTLRLADKLNLAAMTPQNDLASTGYCLANTKKPPHQYLVYLPDGGEATVDLSPTPGRLTVQWFQPATGKFAAENQLDGGARHTIKPPFRGEALAVVGVRL